MSRRNLIILISAVILIIITIILILTVFLRRPGPLPTPAPSGGGFIIPEEPTLPTVSKEKVRALSENPAGALHIVNDRPRFWDKETGFIFETSPDGAEPKRISRDQLADVVNILPLSDNEKIVLAEKENNQIKYSIYNLVSGTKNLLPNGIKSIAVSPDGKKIALYLTDGQKNKLVITDADAINAKTVAELNLDKINLSWTNANMILMAEPASGLASSSILSFNAEKKQPDLIVDNLFGLEAITSSDFSKMIYSKTNQAGGGLSLNLLDLSTREAKSLAIGTFASKCVFSKSNREIFCAVPSELKSSILPDDYYKGILRTNDSLFKINLETAEFSEIINGFERPSFDIVKPLLNSSEDFLFFINNLDDKPYSIKL
ncbi:MAG: hypothetical protein HYV52_02055 [Parcubacteria group bacterium]|nr:hypothetical protein [Parcubacteria group bacterium]